MTREAERGNQQSKARVGGVAMTDAVTTLADLRAAMRDFVAERDWEQFHAPKNLAMGLAIETAELMEHFQWIGEAESRLKVHDPAARSDIADELADVLSYVLALANAMDLDLSAAHAAKMEKTKAKYPVELAKGRYQRPNESEPVLQ